MSKNNSPFLQRLAKKLDIRVYAARAVRRAFVEALKEEVESRYGKGDGGSSLTTPFKLMDRPLIIAGLGSFKMRTRPERTFHGGINEISQGSKKGPCRRLAFTAKWEPIK